jgi:hypothetical protein
VAVRRMSYSIPGERRLCPIDEQLQLQDRSFSYEVQRRIVIEDVTGPYQEAAETLERHSGLKVSKLTCEQVLREATIDFDDFYAHRVAPDPSKTSSILVGTADGKGVPMRRPVKEPDLAGAPVERKKGVKNMATVAAAYTVAPRVRTPEEVVASLFKDARRLELVPTKAERKEVRPESKRVFASLEDGKDGVLTKLAAELEHRDPNKDKIRVVITDGERALQERVVDRRQLLLRVDDNYFYRSVGGHATPASVNPVPGGAGCSRCGHPCTVHVVRRG